MTPQSGSTDSVRDRRTMRRLLIEESQILARQRAGEAMRSIVCSDAWHREKLANGDYTPHPTCAGHGAANLFRGTRVGCLCECHDE